LKYEFIKDFVVAGGGVNAVMWCGQNDGIFKKPYPI
jgi:hypothetical protein